MHENITNRAEPWLIGNWKMNGSLEMLESFELVFRQRFGSGGSLKGATLGLALPDLLLYPSQGIIANTPLTVGIQSCSKWVDGAHTGETSPAMAGALGAKFVLVGHSERRVNQIEKDEEIKAKAETAQTLGLIPIVCIGETLAERESGLAQEVVLRQVNDSCPASGTYIVAYEPVWAIGTGKVATPQQAQEMHAAIRDKSKDSQIRILYGGSMNSSNARELLSQPDIDGGLIGGASLNPHDFLAIFDSRP